MINLDDLLSATKEEQVQETHDVDMSIIDGYAHVKMYRGSDTQNLEGISWWTTDKRLAMGTYYQGVLLERVIRFPLFRDTLISPMGYAIGSRWFLPLTGKNYSYGIDIEVNIENPSHFCVSIDEYALQLMTKKGSVDVWASPLAVY